MRNTGFESTTSNVAAAMIMLSMLKWSFWVLFMIFWIWPILDWAYRIVELIAR